MIHRTLGFGVLVLSLLGLLLCLAGALGVWPLQSRANALGTAVFHAADEAFEFVEAKLGRVRQAVNTTRTRFQGVSQRAQRLQAETDDVRRECQPLLQILQEAREEMRAAEGWLDSSRGVIDGIDRLAEAGVASEYATAHQDAIGVTLAQGVQELTTAVQDSIAQLDAVRQDLVQFRDTGKWVRTAAAGLVARAVDLDAKFARLAARLEQVATSLAKTRQACRDLGRRIHRWIIVATAALSAVLLWFAVAQTGMLVRGWQWAGKRAL